MRHAHSLLHSGILPKLFSFRGQSNLIIPFRAIVLVRVKKEPAIIAVVVFFGVEAVLPEQHFEVIATVTARPRDFA